ncbi:MAG: DinB family protein, partial [Anaerolineae bacterium]
DPEALAAKLARRYEEVDAGLEAAIAGLDDVEAVQCPEEGEWSVQQVLAHLSDGERSFHTVLVNLAVNGWMDADPVYPDDIPGRLEAIIALTPSLRGLADRLQADERETVELVRRLPAETVANKARFRRIAQYVLFGPDHTEEHLGQIRRTVKAVRGEEG